MPEKKKPAAKKTASKAKAAKADAPAILGVEMSRSPGPLPAPASGDARVDELAEQLRRGGAETLAASKALQSEGKRLSGAALAALLVPEVLDLGVLVSDDAVLKGLTPAQKRVYNAAYTKASTASADRAWWLRWVGGAAAQHAEGAARIAEIIADSGVAWQVRELLATVLLAVRPDERAGLDAVATLLDLEGDANALMQARRLGAQAILRRDPKAGFDALSPLLGTPRSSSVVYAAVSEAPRIDERWVDLLLSILGSGDFSRELEAIMVLQKMPPDARMLPAVLRFFGDPTKMTFVVDNAIELLGRCGDHRATPILLRALHMNTGRKDVVLEALRRCGDPNAAPAVRAYEAELRANAYASQLAGQIELATSVATALERRGPATSAAEVPVAAKQPRQQRRLAPSKPAHPMTASADEQRRDLLAAFAEIGITEDVAHALLRPAIALLSTRSTDEAIAVGATKLGGCPDLPPGMPWPREGAQIFGFVAQLRMEELSALDPEGLLPKKGLLSFFVQDESGEPLEYYGAAKVMLLDGPLERCAVPEGFDLRPDGTVIREPYAACTLLAQPIVMVPSAGHPLCESLLPDDKRDAYEDDVRRSSMTHGNQLLGYRNVFEGENDPDVRLLFQVTSDDEAGMEWGDVQDLAFLIRTEDLKKHDFSKVVADVSE